MIRPPEPAQRDKAELFRRLHTQPQLLELSNVWDVTSARAVAGRPGTTAIATASAAIAASRFGPVLKVSEDGLTTFYDGGRIWDL